MSEPLLNYYRAIEHSSHRMLEAARARDWDEVVRHESACAVLIEQLRYRCQSEQLPAADREEKTRIMQRILRNDAEIRVLAEPWLERFEHMFDRQLQVLH
jgi:flagellar protein FliT